MNDETKYYTQFTISKIDFVIISSNTGVKNIIFNSKPDASILRDAAFVQQTDPMMHGIYKQLTEYFMRERKEFDLPLEIEGTDFQKRVWKELEKIPYGETITYKELSVRLGNEKVIRAAASANGANPLSIVIPCHRVIGSDGSLIGYGGGLKVKEKLLQLEGSRQPDLFN